MKSVLWLWLALTIAVTAQNPRFVVLPLDNRPCNLLFVRQLAGVARAEVVFPPRHWLGSWLNPGRCELFGDWLRQTPQPGDNLIVSADMLCYGGLVASRSADTPFALARDRLETLRELHRRGFHLEVLATVPRLSLRTSEAQAPYEAALARWAAHYQAGSSYPPGVPSSLVEEYLGVRRRNLEVLTQLVELAREGVIHRLVFGQDDSAGQGLHVQEQLELRRHIERARVGERVWLGSGADELTMDMVCGRLSELYDFHPGLELEYSEAGSERLIPPLESHPLRDMVNDHLRLCGARAVEKNGQVRLFIQVPAPEPFALPGPERQPAAYAFVERIREFMLAGGRAALADLAYINRCDPYLAQAVIDRLPLTRLEGFAAWNTPANALGTVVAQVVLHRLAEQRAVSWPIARVKESARLHLSFLLARLVDDYGYQTLVRTEFYPEARALDPRPDPLLSPYLPLGRQIRRRLIDWAREVYSRRFQGRLVELPGRRGRARLGPLRLEVVLPWPRLFEVQVGLDVDLLPP